MNPQPSPHQDIFDFLYEASSSSSFSSSPPASPPASPPGSHFSYAQDSPEEVAQVQEEQVLATRKPPLHRHESRSRSRSYEVHRPSFYEKKNAIKAESSRKIKTHTRDTSNDFTGMKSAYDLEREKVARCRAIAMINNGLM